MLIGTIFLRNVKMAIYRIHKEHCGNNFLFHGTVDCKKDTDISTVTAVPKVKARMPEKRGS